MNEEADFKAEANRREADWRQYGLAVDVLTDFVFQRLSDKSASDYKPFELFSEEAIAAILKQGIKTIDANRNGHRMAWFGSDGGGSGSLEDGPKLAKVFRDWASSGCIEFQEASGDGVSYARLIKR